MSILNSSSNANRMFTPSSESMPSSANIESSVTLPGSMCCSRTIISMTFSATFISAPHCLFSVPLQAPTVSRGYPDGVLGNQFGDPVEQVRQTKWLLEHRVSPELFGQFPFRAADK